MGTRPAFGNSQFQDIVDVCILVVLRLGLLVLTIELSSLRMFV